MSKYVAFEITEISFVVRYGELALGDSPDRNQPCAVNIGQKDIQRILQVAAGNELTIVLTSKYEVFCCGYNDSGQCGVLSMNRVPELTRVDCLSVSP